MLVCNMAATFSLIHFVINIALITLLLAIVRCDDEYTTCVNNFGSYEHGCSARPSDCCASLSILIKDLDTSCEAISNSSQLVITVRSDLYLNKTIYFENFCDTQALKIQGTQSTNIICSENSEHQMNAGFHFSNVRNLAIKNLSLTNCGSLQLSTSKNMSSNGTKAFYFHSSLYFLNCSNVSLINIKVCEGHGIGAAIFDTNGTVSITDCLFMNNKVRNLNYPGGGGLYIEFTTCSPGTFVNCRHNNHGGDSALYTIKRCTFSNNNASLIYGNQTSYLSSSSPFQGFGRGGGLAVYVNGNTKQHFLNVLQCQFQNNSAVFGGGMFVLFRDSPSNNSVVIKDTHFIHNNCYRYGGGGAGCGFILSKAKNSTTAVYNAIEFVNCSFVGNTVNGNGGGLSIFSTKGVSSTILTNSITLQSCNLYNNSAFVASALDLSLAVYDRLGSGILLVPLIADCQFISNYLLNTTQYFIVGQPNETFTSSLSGVGTVFISAFQVEFKGRIVFSHNLGTALHMSSASVNLLEGSSLHFESNHGKYGGAVSMYGFSVLQINNSCNLEFVDNSAVSGGAFYIQSIDDQHESYFSHSCFIQYKGATANSTERNITIVFQNNTAQSGDGHMLYVTSLLPCGGNEHFFDSLGSVTYQNDNSNGYEVTTLASKFHISSGNLKQMQEIIPGIEFHLSVSASDELNQKLKTVYKGLIHSSDNITIDPAYTQVSNNIIKLHGRYGSVGTLALETTTASMSISIRLGQCPPGFLNLNNSCVCSPSQFEAIARCKHSQAYIYRGFWIGLCENDTICMAHCPPGFCSYHGDRSEVLKLPSSESNLDYFVCGPLRTGILCGKCKVGLSVYYHSNSYYCKHNKLCHLGIIFYILSEILPLMIFFFIINVCNIRFTSGAVNGFILFAQISDSMDVTASDSIDFPKVVYAASYPLKFIYRIFNLDFFGLEPLSFCLWKNATTLDVLAMKYVTITFALSLILVTVFVFNSWKFKVWCKLFRPQSLRAAFTHGLTTLLIVCFSQCARVSFSILSPTWLHRVDQSNMLVVLYSGELQPFHKGHIQYALPALMFLLILVMLPSLWLLLYPILFKVLGLCHLSESKLSRLLSMFFPIELLDSFQSCFKDNCRYFAGLYFMYRLIPLILSSVIKNTMNFHVLMAVLFLMMFTLHSAIRPYKTHWHNIIDTFMLADISLINLLTSYNYAILAIGDDTSLGNIVLISYVQLFLMYFPIAYITFYGVGKMYLKTKSQYVKGYSNIDNSNLLPPLRDSS